MNAATCVEIVVCVTPFLGVPLMAWRDSKRPDGYTAAARRKAGG